uniref:Uncharacterized protein n=1 Tax=Fagus sylvatica TaxID=28930 RepID=A0A2N9HTJ6_FAGSY
MPSFSFARIGPRPPQQRSSTPLSLSLSLRSDGGGLVVHGFAEGWVCTGSWRSNAGIWVKSFCVDGEDKSSNWVRVDLTSDKLGKNPLGLDFGECWILGNFEQSTVCVMLWVLSIYPNVFSYSPLIQGKVEQWWPCVVVFWVLDFVEYCCVGFWVRLNNGGRVW